MRRLVLRSATITLVACPLAAQGVPARNLPAFPLGRTAEAPAPGTTLSAPVADLTRTESDLQSIGDEIPHSTTLRSLLAARRLAAVTVGAAFHHRGCAVGVAREESSGNRSATYRFSPSSPLQCVPRRPR